MSDAAILWSPDPKLVKHTQVQKFIDLLNKQHALKIKSFHELYDFSVANSQLFWSNFLDYSGLSLKSRGSKILTETAEMLGSRWFEDSTLNFAENLLAPSQTDPERPAVIFWCEDRLRQELSFGELASQVNALRNYLRKLGIQPGDRVAAITSNCPQSIVAMLASAAEGAIWSSCSPDFGVAGIRDRFEQIAPTILIAVSGYYYKGQYFDITSRIEELAQALPSLKAIFVYALDGQPATKPKCTQTILDLREVSTPTTKLATLQYAALPFNHPLYILFSSGTTGKPKCIIHGAGGTLLEHLKELKLHCNLTGSEKIFYNTTCGWMMWNWLVSSLAVGATVVLYDGFPLLNDGKILFDLAEQEKIDIFGTSAGFLSAINKAGLAPIKSYKLEKLRMLLSTGSVLAPEQYDYVYQSIKNSVQLCSVSGGTDIVGCFALGAPTIPVYRGQLQTRSLGYAVDIFDQQGQSLRNAAGELVCTKPFPSMPLGFWNDDQKQTRYQKAYFAKFPKVWCHGDYAEITKQNGIIIYGRSDATLNPGGVRIGTAEIYRQLENFPEIILALVTGLIKSFDEEIVLFVKLTEQVVLNDSLRDKIKAQIRTNASPRHVPRHIIQVPDIPITRSGKVSELTVKRIINSQAIDNLDALANPECLGFYRDLKL